jgi:hypothetical protein
MAPRRDLLFVLGVAHCGSTLLGRCLDMHAQVLCTGETLRAAKALEEGRPCGCGQPIERCPFWRASWPKLAVRRGGDWRRFDAELLRSLAREHQREVLVDLSKTLAFQLARRWQDPRLGFVLLVRDPRGALASVARERGDVPRSLARLLKWLARMERWAARQAERVHVLRYEDLARAPQRELAGVLGFLGLPFDPAVLRPADRAHHFVHSSVSGYLQSSNEIRLDERWRGELEPEVLARIERDMGRSPLLRGYLAESAPA